MHIISLGLNHTSAPVHLRERLAFNEGTDPCFACACILWSSANHSLAELIIISTCNRTEIYAASNQLAYAELEAFLSDARGARRRTSSVSVSLPGCGSRASFVRCGCGIGFSCDR